MMSALLQRRLPLVLWPLLFGTCVGIQVAGQAAGAERLTFFAVYFILAATLFGLERLLPARREWLEDDGQMLPDLLHTLFTKGFVFLVVLGFQTAVQGREATGLWPAHVPFVLQVLLGLLVSEFGLYWAHRLAHTNAFLWRFHAVHHSVRKLWFWNTGRFHFVDTVVSLVLGLFVLILAGAPEAVLTMTSAITAFVGLLTHCNVRMVCGPLNLVFNTPELHRWHHSIDPAEGNTNFGENLMVFDHLFGTWFLPPQRVVGRIGIRETMPANFLGQLARPFHRTPAPSPAEETASEAEAT